MLDFYIYSYKQGYDQIFKKQVRKYEIEKSTLHITINLILLIQINNISNAKHQPANFDIFLLLYLLETPDTALMDQINARPMASRAL